MKKILSLCAAVICACAMFAVEATFDFSTDAGLTAMGITKAASGAGTTFTTATIDGVVITADKGSATTNPRVWTASSGATDFRIYSGSTLTIAGAQSTDLITKIEMSGGDLKFAELTTGQWVGSANSVTFTPTATCKVSTIIVTMNEEAVVYIPDTITVSEAKALIVANDPKIHKGHFVKGVVAGDPFELNGLGPAFYMSDITNPADSLEGFKIAKDAQGTAFTDANDMASVLSMGDTIMIYAAGLAKYNNIYETTSGYFAEMLGKLAATVLTWNFADATYDNGNWTITIAATNANTPADALTLIFPSTESKGIAGFHTLAEGSAIKQAGSSAAITSGSVQLAFKSISNNNYNNYEVKMSAMVGEALYRINNEIEIPAFNADGDEIVLTADRPYVPQEDEEMTCALAQEYAFSLASGATSEIRVIVKGYVTKVVDANTFWMDDAQGTKETFEAYKVKKILPAGQTIVKDAYVKLTGYITNYNGKTAEIKDGDVEIVSGGQEIVPQEVTVAEALAAAQALAPNATSEGYYAITGYISGIVTEYSAQYGNISFWMSDAADDAQNFQAYRAKCDASIADKLVVGAKVKVTDKIKHFHQDATEGDDPKPERTVYETNGGGTVILIQGAGVEDINVNAPAVKFIENGRIIILRNGVRYDVQGRIAE